MARRKGKYEHITGKLQRLPMVAPERRDIVSAVQQTIQSHPHRDVSDDPSIIRAKLEQMDAEITAICELMKGVTGGRHEASAYARAYATLRRIGEDVDRWRGSIQLLLDAYEELMVSQMEVEGIASQRLADGSSVSYFLEPAPQVLNKEEFRQWCISQGLESQMFLHPSTAASLIKEMMRKGEKEPPGVQAYSLTKVRFTPA